MKLKILQLLLLFALVFAAVLLPPALWEGFTIWNIAQAGGECDLKFGCRGQFNLMLFIISCCSLISAVGITFASLILQQWWPAYGARPGRLAGVAAGLMLAALVKPFFGLQLELALGISLWLGASVVIFALFLLLLNLFAGKPKEVLPSA